MIDFAEALVLVLAGLIGGFSIGFIFGMNV
jgi:hypothetical protein